MIYTSGSGETLQPVIAGGVDLGFAVGTLGAMAAYAKGAPVRIIGAQATGAADYWYAKTSSPIKTLKDTNGHTIAFSTNGSSTQQRRPRLHRRIQAHRQADGDRQSDRDADRRDDRSGRCRLGLAAVRPQGNGRGQDPSGRARDRRRAGARPDHPRASWPTPRSWQSARTSSSAS